MEGTAACNLKLERWGSLLFQKGMYREKKPVRSDVNMTRVNQFNKITVLIY
jgi:hypothetical protein